MTDSEQSTQPSTGWLKRLAPLAVVAILIGVGFKSGLHKYLAPDTLFATLEGFRGWVDAHMVLAALAFIGVYASLVAISFPGATLLTIGGGYMFGQWIGTGAVVIAATIGATIIFLLAKTVFGDVLAKKAGGLVKKMEDGFKDGELNYMFLLRLVPAFPFVAVNVGAGLLNVSLRNYVIGTFFGIIPGTAVFVSIGNAIAAGTKSLEDAGLAAVFSQPQVYIPFIGLAFLGSLPILLKKFGGEKVATQSEETPS